MKNSAKKPGQILGKNEKDEGVVKWLYTSLPDDFFKLGIELNF